jgi:putative hydrolase of HD superfamily
MNPDIEKYRILNKAKTTYRFATAGGHHESSAEHMWGCLLLADYFLSSMKTKIDRLKAYELLMYHDIVEIEVGDTPIHPDAVDSTKSKRESDASVVLSKKLPSVLSQKYLDLFNEYEAGKTIEARFARAIDGLEAEIHELDYKQDWEGWTKEFLVSKKAYLFEDFPEMKEAFNGIVEYLDTNGYFSK